MLIFKNNNLRLSLKNKKIFVFLQKQLFFIQPLIFLKSNIFSFFYWLFFVLKNLQSFGLFFFNKNFLKNFNIKTLK